MQPHCNLTNLPSISWQAEGEEQNLSAHDKRTREGDENDKNWYREVAWLQMCVQRAIITIGMTKT